MFTKRRPPPPIGYLARTPERPPKHTHARTHALLLLFQVSGLVSQAEAYLKAGDYGAAMRAADAGMRIDAGNSDLQAVLDRAKPKFEASERSRRSGLSSTELLKEKGDDFYKKAAFEVGRWCV